jgi:Inner membrane component of T3SS, cytoplasmic domain
MTRATRQRQLFLAGAILAAASLAAARPAAAQDKTYTLEVILPKPKAPPEGTEGDAPPPDPDKINPDDGLPTIRAVASGRVGLTAKDFVLKQSDVQPPLVIEALKSMPYRESDEPLALVVLVQGNFRWMGNESYKSADDPEDQGSVYDGAFRGLPPAVDVLAKAGPQGSQAALLVYAQGNVDVKQPMADAAKLTGAGLGSQQDYGENVSQPLVLGLSEAWKLLVKMPDFRRALVVFGDGVDVNPEDAGALKKAITDLQEAKVEVYSIFYNPHDDGPQGQQNMAKIGYTEHFKASSRDNFRASADSVVEAINAKYYVDFPGDAIQFDGAEHEFMLSVGGEDKEPRPLALPTVVKPVDEGSLWWVWLLVILLLLVLIIVVILIMRRQPAEEPLPVAPPPVLGPMKTIMIGIGGGDDSMPVVGWVVPLAGPNQFQTFKLLQGSTKLGTGGESHIVIGDSFMSAEHAEIVCSASGFVLNDLGSTNGTFVNARRVSSHELVDNDVFKLGKTDFKFKSIN